MSWTKGSKTNMQKWKTWNEKNSWKVHFLEELSILKAYSTSPKVLFFKKSPLNYMSQHIFFDIFFFVPPLQIDSLVTPLSEAWNES